MYIKLFTQRDDETYFRFNEDSYYLIGWLHEDTADGDTEDGDRIAPIFSYCGNMPVKDSGTSFRVSILVGAPTEDYDNKEDRKRIKRYVSDAMRPLEIYPVETIWDDIEYYRLNVREQPISPYFYN